MTDDNGSAMAAFCYFRRYCNSIWECYIPDSQRALYGNYDIRGRYVAAVALAWYQNTRPLASSTTDTVDMPRCLYRLLPSWRYPWPDDVHIWPFFSSKCAHPSYIVCWYLLLRQSLYITMSLSIMTIRCWLFMPILLLFLIRETVWLTIDIYDMIRDMYAQAILIAICSRICEIICNGEEVMITAMICSIHIRYGDDSIPSTVSYDWYAFSSRLSFSEIYDLYYLRAFCDIIPWC